jgi:hypothetical protein
VGNRRLFRLDLDKPKTSPDPESGQAISNCEMFTLILADNLHLGNQQSVLFCALNRKTRADQFQLA